jgi:glycolate oxidase FAD binding subunit
LIDWHGGQRWYKAAPGAAAQIRAAARAAGGHATLFRAPASTSAITPAARIPRFDALSAPLARVHAALMREFDPQRIFNPGRLYAAT